MVAPPLMPQVSSLMTPPGTPPDLSIPIDPSVIMQLLIEDRPDFAKKYPPHYKKEQWKKPKPENLWGEYRREERRNHARVARILETWSRLRFETAGIFDRDKDIRATMSRISSSRLIWWTTGICSARSWHHSTSPQPRQP